MTEPGDHDEREADAIANSVMSGGKITRKISSGGSGSSGIAVSSQMESQLNHLQGGGQVMPEGLRSMMESGFGRDFSQVRLHTDSEAATMSSNIHAKAFTHGNDIYFNSGQFSPETSEGQRLVAHELAHVAQSGGKVGRKDWGSFSGPSMPGSYIEDIKRMKALEDHLKNTFFQPPDNDWSAHFLINGKYPTNEKGEKKADCDVLSTETIRFLEQSGYDDNDMNKSINAMNNNAIDPSMYQNVKIEGRKYTYIPILIPGFHMMMLIKGKSGHWFLQDGQEVYCIHGFSKDKVIDYVLGEWNHTVLYYNGERIERSSVRNNAYAADFVDVSVESKNFSSPLLGERRQVEL